MRKGKNQKGIVLPMVLIIFAVLAILGLAVFSISAADHRHSLRQENRLQAYYIARSAAQTMAEYIMDRSYSDSYESMSRFLNALSNNESGETAINDGSFRIKTKIREADGQQVLDIVSTGYYKGASETVTVSLLVTVETSGGEYNPSSEAKALVVLSEDAPDSFVLTNGAFIQGDVVVNATMEDSVIFSGGSGFNILQGSLYLPTGTDPAYVIKTDRGARNGDAPEEYRKPGIPDYQYISNWAFWLNIENGVKYYSKETYPSTRYPELIFPDFDALDELPAAENPNLTTPEWNVTYTIAQDCRYQTIRPSSSRTIYVDMGGGNRIIRTGTLDLTGGNMELINAGPDSRLYIFVDNAFSLGSSRTLNSNGVPDNVQIYYAGASTVQIDGSARFAGNIFVKQANVVFTAGAFMRGNIATLGTQVNVSGGSAAHDMILYAPNARVEMSGSAQIRGSLIARTFVRSGGGNAGVVYTPSSYPIPGEFFGSGSNKINIRYSNNPWN